MVSHRALPSAPQPMTWGWPVWLPFSPANPVQAHPRFTEVVHIHRAASSSSVWVSKGFVYLLLEVTVKNVSKCFCCLATVYCSVFKGYMG